MYPAPVRERRDQRGLVELGVVGEDEDDVAATQLAALEITVGPIDDHLRGA